MRTIACVLVLVGCVVGDLAAQTRPAAAPQPPAGTARIRGTLVDATTGTPLRRASMRLRTVPSTRNSWTAFTDGNGVFDFPSLPAGQFTLTATKGGYITLSAGQRTPADAAQRIQVTEGQTVDLPPLRLPRGGVITGRIGDQYGDAAPEITVQVLRAEYMQGTRRLASVRSVRTDDIGQYRIYGLQPGTYYVATSARGADGSPLQIMEPGTEAVPGGRRSIPVRRRRPTPSGSRLRPASSPPAWISRCSPCGWRASRVASSTRAAVRPAITR